MAIGPSVMQQCHNLEALGQVFVAEWSTRRYDGETIHRDPFQLSPARMGFTVRHASVWERQSGIGRPEYKVISLLPTDDAEGQYHLSTTPLSSSLACATVSLRFWDHAQGGDITWKTCLPLN